MQTHYASIFRIAQPIDPKRATSLCISLATCTKSISRRIPLIPIPGYAERPGSSDRRTEIMPISHVPADTIPALTPRGPGHQFLLYGDSCSGVPGALHERTFAAVNNVVRRLAPLPEFVIFTGDEVAGLTADPVILQAQWRYWLEQEMGWLDRSAVPLWHTTGNHTTYNAMSERVFAETLDHLPRNGPPGQQGLSYWVRDGDLLLVFVHTLWTGLGGEGHVEIEWLRQVLASHADARHRLVIGHHPVYPVNGFSGPYQREIGPEHATAFWDVLTEHRVLAYVCSHILAYDVQVHRGVLQICTAGAGTAHRMPEGVEYLHCIQAALDANGLRYQVLDTTGVVRERLSWPVMLAPSATWADVPFGASMAMVVGAPGADRVLAFRFSGSSAPAGYCRAQTLLCAFQPGVQPPFWIGLCGPEQVLTVIIGPEPGRSPHYWIGPACAAGSPFAFQLLVHTGMGPGGILLRPGDDGPWSSLSAASPWGAERLAWPECWTAGHGPEGSQDRPFMGSGLRTQIHAG